MKQRAESLQERLGIAEREHDRRRTSRAERPLMGEKRCACARALGAPPPAALPTGAAANEGGGDQVVHFCSGSAEGGNKGLGVIPIRSHFGSKLGQAVWQMSAPSHMAFLGCAGGGSSGLVSGGASPLASGKASPLASGGASLLASGDASWGGGTGLPAESGVEPADGGHKLVPDAELNAQLKCRF